MDMDSSSDTEEMVAPAGPKETASSDRKPPMGGKVYKHELQKASNLMDDVARSPALKKLEGESDLKKPTSPKKMSAPAGPSRPQGDCVI